MTSDTSGKAITANGRIKEHAWRTVSSTLPTLTALTNTEPPTTTNPHTLERSKVIALAERNAI